MDKEGKGMTKGQTIIVVSILIAAIALTAYTIYYESSLLLCLSELAVALTAYPIYYKWAEPGPETRRVEGSLVWKGWSSSLFGEKYKLTIRNGSRKHTFTVGKDSVSDESWRTVEQLEVGDRVTVYYHTQKAKKGVVEKVVERVEEG